jgi:integrase
MPKLTVLTVQRMKEVGLHSDGRGLYINVSSTGAKSWIFRYMLHGRARSMGLGSVANVTLAQAREKAARFRAVVKGGIDPLEGKHAEKAQHRSDAAKRITFAAATAQYIEAHRSSWKNIKHADQWENTLETYAAEHIGKMDVARIETEHVLKVLQPIWATKTETATRTRGRIEKILDWCSVHGYRSESNPARWKGNLEALLPPAARVQKRGHFAALPFKDMPTFMEDVKSAAGTAARALEFAILTAARSGEVRGARWEEMDLVEKLWIVPAERMKMGREHRVPLSDRAVAILQEMFPQDAGLIFQGITKRGEPQPLSDMSLSAVLRRMKRTDITVHGFRSTFRDWVSETTDHSADVAEMALAHTIRNKVESAYRRGDLMDKRRALMSDWAKYCEVK